MNWLKSSRVIFRPGSGRVKATSCISLTVTTPAAPAKRGPEPSFSSAFWQRKILPVYEPPARLSGWQDLHLLQEYIILGVYGFLLHLSYSEYIILGFIFKIEFCGHRTDRYEILQNSSFPNGSCCYACSLIIIFSPVCRECKRGI
jgi:hypothetical protein